MSLYSAIQFTSVSFLYTSASNLGDFQVSQTFSRTVGSTRWLTKSQFLFIDLALILPIAIFSESYHSVRLRVNIDLCQPSGLDGPLSGAFSETPNSRPCLAQSFDPSPRTNCDLHLDPIFDL